MPYSSSSSMVENFYVSGLSAGCSRLLEQHYATMHDRIALTMLASSGRQDNLIGRARSRIESLVLAPAHYIYGADAKPNIVRTWSYPLVLIIMQLYAVLFAAVGCQPISLLLRCRRLGEFILHSSASALQTFLRQ